MTHRIGLFARAGRRAALVCLLVAPFCRTASLADDRPGIAWRTEFHQAQAAARAQNRLLWIQFTGPWCHFCRLMERDVFAHPEVAARARDQFVPLRLRSDEHEDLVLRFGVTGLPATIIVGTGGEIIARKEGYVDSDTFRSFLDSTLQATGRTPQVASAANEPQPERGQRDDGEIALAGYCPVTLVQGKRLEEGQTELSVRYEGREYRFASSSSREAFLKDPELFLPANGGQCVVSLVDRARVVEGDPRFGVLYRGRLYLCADDSTRERFLKNPERYWNADVADRGFCPHCRNLKGLLVRGSPRYAATHAGRRYFFPDPVHLAAFRESPDKYVR